MSLLAAKKPSSISSTSSKVMVSYIGMDYTKSLHEVLQWHGVKGLVNRRDDQDNTALHYATQMWDLATVRQLLELRANIGLKNHWEENPT